MTYPGNHPDDETRQFRPLDGLAQGDGRTRPDQYGYGQPQNQQYQEPYGHPADNSGYAAPEQPHPPRTRNATLSEMYDTSGLATEAAIVSVLWGVLFGFIAWVVDLLAVRASDAGSGDYSAYGAVTAYVMLGFIAAVALGIGFLLVTGLSLGVNEPAQVWTWAVLVIPLGCLIILLTGGSWWNTIPAALTLIIGAIPLWTLAPIRVSNYRNADVPRRIVER